MEQISKKQVHWDGHEYYLLGESTQGTYLWLKEPIFNGSNWIAGEIYETPNTEDIEHSTLIKTRHNWGNLLYSEYGRLVFLCEGVLFKRVTFTEVESMRLCDLIYKYFTSLKALQLVTNSFYGNCIPTKDNEGLNLAHKNIKEKFNGVLIPYIMEQINGILMVN